MMGPIRMILLVLHSKVTQPFLQIFTFTHTQMGSLNFYCLHLIHSRTVRMVLIILRFQEFIDLIETVTKSFFDRVLRTHSEYILESTPRT